MLTGIVTVALISSTLPFYLRCPKGGQLLIYYNTAAHVAGWVGPNTVGKGAATSAPSHLDFWPQLQLLGTYYFYLLQDQSGNPVYLSVTHAGVVIFQGSKRTRVFQWLVSFFTSVHLNSPWAFEPFAVFLSSVSNLRLSLNLKQDLAYFVILWMSFPL